MIKILLVTALLAACAVSIHGAGLVSCRSDKLVPFPLGVADSDGRVGYISNDQEGIDALDLSSGKVLWSSSEAIGALIAYRGGLVAGTRGIDENILTVVILDTQRSGQVVLKSEVKFPQWVTVSLKGGDTFYVKPSLQRAGSDCVLILEWQASASYKGGAPAPEWVEQRERKTAAGKVFVNLRTGRSEVKTDAARATLSKTKPALPRQKGLWKYERGTVEGYLVGTRVYYLVEEPQSSGSPHRAFIKARDFASGRVLWEHTVRLYGNVKAPPRRP